MLEIKRKVTHVRLNAILRCSIATFYYTHTYIFIFIMGSLFIKLYCYIEIFSSSLNIVRYIWLVENETIYIKQKQIFMHFILFFYRLNWFTKLSYKYVSDKSAFVAVIINTECYYGKLINIIEYYFVHQ